MCRARSVLMLVAMCVGVAHCWGGTKTDTVLMNTQNIAALAYDAAHNMMLYVDRQRDNDTICGYEISTKKTDCYIKRNGRNIHSLAYEPRTEILFFTDANEKSINWISLKRGSKNNIYGNLLIKLDDRTPADIVVDSCKGNIYWSNTNVTKEPYMERARFDGSERTVAIDNYDFPILSMAMDPQDRIIYHFDDCGAPCTTIFLNRLFLNGKPLQIVYSNTMPIPKEVVVSNDYLYWMSSSKSYKTLWQFPKNASRYSAEPLKIRKFFTRSKLGIVANYKTDGQIKGMEDCESLISITPMITPGNTCERCNVCVNHCFQGNCSFNDEGLPKCSCSAGYTGPRCEVYACHGYCSNNGNCSLNENSAPVCQCNGDYSGDRCEVSHCLNYCLQGNCSLSDDGHPTCSCNAGYTGPRCEVDACHGYCSNNGNCSLKENSEPVCLCKEGYLGDKCEVSHCLNYCIQGNCSLFDDGHPTCSCSAGYIGERCEVSVCVGYCLNDGECSLNEEDQPVCECDYNHEGSRCEADKSNTFTFTNTSTYYSAQKNLSLADLLSNWRKPTVKISVNVEV